MKNKMSLLDKTIAYSDSPIEQALNYIKQTYGDINMTDLDIKTEIEGIMENGYSVFNATTIFENELFGIVKVGEDNPPYKDKDIEGVTNVYEPVTPVTQTSKSSLRDDMERYFEDDTENENMSNELLRLHICGSDNEYEPDLDDCVEYVESKYEGYQVGNPELLKTQIAELSKEKQISLVEATQVWLKDFTKHNKDLMNR